MDAETVRFDPSNFWRIQAGSRLCTLDAARRSLDAPECPVGPLLRPVDSLECPVDGPERPVDPGVTFVRIVAEVTPVAFSSCNLLRTMASCVYEQNFASVAPRCCWR